MFICYVMYAWRFSSSCLGVCGRCLLCHLLIWLRLLCWSVCSVFGLFDMCVGCCVYVLCNVCVAVPLVMYVCLWSLHVLSFASLSALTVIVVLLIVFVLCGMCTGMCG